MIWQVNATILFDIEDEANDFYHDCELAFPKGVIINPGQPNAEHSIIEKLISNHDLDPNEASILLQSESNQPS